MFSSIFSTNYLARAVPEGGGGTPENFFDKEKTATLSGNLKAPI